MESKLALRIILESPPAGVDFGVQKGRGSIYETIEKQRAKGGDLLFDFTVRVKADEGAPNFLGPIVQGPPQARFVYLDIGTCAGQTETQWSRRLKIPLSGISAELIRQALGSAKVLTARVPGTGGDGGPTCGTVKPFDGWKLK